MRKVLLLTIRLYWVLSPARTTGRCLFSTSCSRYVYRITQEQGLFKGMAALRYRFRSCRGGFHILENSLQGTRSMILCTGEEIPECEMAERFQSKECAAKVDQET